MSVLRDSPLPPEHSYTLLCDARVSPGCLEILDPGALDAPMGGWRSEDEAIHAGLSHGWTVDLYDGDWCPPCWTHHIARFGTGAA
jgi:hypothetical protein